MAEELYLSSLQLIVMAPVIRSPQPPRRLRNLEQFALPCARAARYSNSKKAVRGGGGEVISQITLG